MRNHQRHAMIEPMETRRMMSVTSLADEPDTQSAMLLPAVQAAREAAKAKVTHTEIVIVKRVDVASAALM